MARGLGGEPLAPFNQGHLEAMAAAGPGEGAAGDAAANDGKRRSPGPRPVNRFIVASRNGVAFGAETGAPLDVKACRLETPAHLAGRRKAGQAGPGRRVARQLLEQLGAPHGGVQLWCKAIQIPGVDGRIAIAQNLDRLAE